MELVLAYLDLSKIHTPTHSVLIFTSGVVYSMQVVVISGHMYFNRIMDIVPPPKTDNESGINSQPEERKKLSIFNITILFSQVGYFPLAYVREDEDE